MKRITKEHFKILQVEVNANLDEVKKAYRKRAFELHPDLNPNNPNAQKEFQKLNEAYILMIEYFNIEKNTKAKASSKYQEQSSKTEAKKEEKSSSAEQEAKAQQEQAQREKAQREKAQREEAQKKEAQEEERRKEQQKTESHKRTYAKSSANSANDDARKKAQSAYAKEGSKAQSRVFSEKAKAEEQKSSQKPPTQEEVMRDILNDPFARRVYEDIYSSLNTEKKESSASSTQDKKDKSQDKKVNIDWNTDKASELANGMKGYMKSWFKKQIDDTLEFRFPISSLYPGSRIRLQIGQGFSKETKTVDITLPRDFVIGKPVRLAGLGKKVGKWQGDLFIVLLPTLPK